MKQLSEMNAYSIVTISFAQAFGKFDTSERFSGRLKKLCYSTAIFDGRALLSNVWIKNFTLQMKISD